MPRYYRTIAPAVSLVSLDEAKAHLRVDAADDDELITGLIEAAEQWLDGSGQAPDGYLNRALVNQTWRAEAPWPDHCGRLLLERGPVQSVTSVETLVDGAYVAWDTAQWRLGFDGDRGFVIPNSGFAWPNHDLREDAIRVTYVAGYGAAADDVPAPIRRAALLIVGHLYENREAVTVAAAPSEMPFAVKALLAPFRKIPI